MFYGTFEHALDEKHRVMVPAKLREEIPPAEAGVFYVTLGLDNCLFVYTSAGWQAVVARLQQGKDSLRSAAARNFMRLFFSRAMRQELDAAGRLLIPDALRQLAGLRRDVALVGVMDRIEIWDRARWTRLERSNQPRYERFAEEAELFG